MSQNVCEDTRVVLDDSRFARTPSSGVVHTSNERRSVFRCRRRRRRTRSRLRRLSRRATRTAGTRVRRRARRTAARLVGSEGPVPAVQQKPPEREHEEHHEVRGHEARDEVKRLFFNAMRVVYQSVVVVFCFYRRRRRMRTPGGDGRGGEKRKAKREKRRGRLRLNSSKRVRDEIDRDGRFRARERETKQKTRRAFPETRTHAAAISGLVSIHRTHTHGFLLPHPNASVRASPTRRRNASSFSSSSSPPLVAAARSGVARARCLPRTRR